MLGIFGLGTFRTNRAVCILRLWKVHITKVPLIIKYAMVKGLKQYFEKMCIAIQLRSIFPSNLQTILKVLRFAANKFCIECIFQIATVHVFTFYIS